ncbi:MAG: hypothetical protein MRERC_6c030 [Mycoplasmataceae bacterium RC_NB112A]|nr:MAG: hypothetical protein MRERC_13c032 [Mycoplasmataceae bacterium RC_NB112A]KLL01944.1 MAG: hypothetical protein MRERC_6c030 [Mycoplasmataceae bacterium RC_NB112A]
MSSKKDLCQISGAGKSTTPQEINSLVLKNSPKDNPEVGKALMFLSDPQKKIEYDKFWWKNEGESDWEKERNFRHYIFEVIQNYKHHYGIKSE